MDNDKITELLLKLSEDIAYIKGRLDTLDDLRLEQKTLGARIDKLESKSQEMDKSVKSLEHRNDTMEEFVRNNMHEESKTSKSIFISAGLALFGAILSFFFNLL